MADRTLCIVPRGRRLPRPESAPPAFSPRGRFRDAVAVGEGGMGRVFCAFDTALGRPVVLKFPWRAESGAGGRTLHEARLQRIAAGPHVPELFEVGSLGGLPYLSMTWLAAPTLKAAARRMSFADRCAAAVAVCRALHAVHQAGIVHRDVNPANLLVERRTGGWWPWVIDFGIAHEHPHPGRRIDPAVVGTASYMAPEQARGQGDRIDRRTDVYSLGATLYELFSGRRPFRASSSQDVLAQAVSQPPRPLLEAAPSLPAALAGIVHRCLDKDPDRRFPSAGALADALEGLC